VIVVSLLLFLAGVALLAAGLVRESIPLEVASIAAALLSALVLYLGVRQRRPLAAEGQLDGEVEPSAPAHPPAHPPVEPVEPGAEPVEPQLAPHQPVTQPPTQPAEPVVLADRPRGGAHVIASLDRGAVHGSVARPTVDEPDEEPVRSIDVPWISAQPDIVQVVDGHPRYHVGLCPSLRNQEVFPMPVSEARQEGFTPCGRCRPDSTILDTAWRSHLNPGER